jgi:hypothetical protein
MKTYQEETELAFHGIPQGTISYVSHKNGLRGEEPLIVILDALIGYAKSYQDRYGSKLATDYVLGPEWLSALVGTRGLLNGDGAIAMTQGITTDSKDNGACEAMFWSAMDIAGFTEADL